MNEDNKRKAIILTFIGALTLLFVVVGGTFAYFQIVNTNEGSTSTDFNAQTDNLNKYGTPLLTKKSDLYISLSASDMAYSKKGTSYWATETKDPQDIKYETERKNHIISTASIERPDSDDAVEDAYLKCTSELTITITGEMKDVLQTGDGTLYLGTTSSDGNSGSVTPASFDLADLVSKEATKENKATVNYTITGFTSVDVTADIEIVNKEETPQNDLAGTKIEITITNNNLSCSVSEKTTKDILKEKDSGNYLSPSLVGGMYRYQGLATDDIRNYICLGDNCCKEESCPASSEDDMYRIIGITDNGEMKVIKKTALTEGIQWWSEKDRSSDIKWPESLIYQKLNGKSEGSTDPNYDDVNSYYYSLDANLKNKIINNHSWLYGDAYDSNDFGYNGDTIYGIESGKNEAIYFQEGDIFSPTGKGEWNDRIEAPIGLMYLSDYLYTENPGSSKNEVNSWLYISYNETTHPSNSTNLGYEWTMSRYGLFPEGGCFLAWYLEETGKISYDYLTDNFALRPTFYLSSDVELTGEGSLTNPFYVVGVGQ